MISQLIFPLFVIVSFASFVIPGSSLLIAFGSARKASQSHGTCAPMYHSEKKDQMIQPMTMANTVTKRAYGVVEKLDLQQISTKSSSSSFDIYRLFVTDDGTFPNNPDYPLILFKDAFQGSQADGHRAIMASGDWTSPWVWGIFTFHHYHSNAWELLLCVQGTANVQLGGPSGSLVDIHRGDVIWVPPGVAHKQLEASDDFTLLGSYPTATNSKYQLGSAVDTLRGVPSPQEQQNIAKCPLPPTKDPIFGFEFQELFNC